MALLGRRHRAGERLGAAWSELVGRILAGAGLDPHLIGRLAPAREHADAVAGRRDRVEVLEQVLPAKALEHPLADRVGGLDVERDAGHRSDRAERDHEPVEIGIAAGGGHDVAVGCDQLKRGDGAREVAVAISRPVRCRRDRAGNRDVRKRRQVREAEPRVLELDRELAVAHRAGAGHGHRVAIDDDVGRESVQAHELGRVGDVGERVARSEDADVRRRRDDLPDLVERRRGVNGARAVGVIPGPVRRRRRVGAHVLS